MSGRPADGPRWMFAGGLVAGEYLLASLFLEHPREGAPFLVSAVRLGFPVGLAALFGGWMLARGARAPAPAEPLPPWRPWPAVGLQVVAYGLTAALAWPVLRPGAPAVSGAALAPAFAAGLATVALALRTAAPLGWVARLALSRLRLALLALGLGLAAWTLAALAESSWGALSASTLRGAAALLGAARGDVTVVPEARLLGAGDFEVEVAPVCSGVDGLGLVALFQAVWIALARDRLRVGRALLLLPLGALAALAGNVLRIAALVWVGAAGHPDLAVGGFHSKLGWILFIAIALASMAAAERVAWFRRPGAGSPAADAQVPAAGRAYLGPFLAALATALVTGLLASGPVDRAYGLRVAAAVAALLAFRRDLPAPSLAPGWAPVAGAALVCALWIPLAPGDGAALDAALRALAPAERYAWIAARVLGSVLVVPLVEELAFRGFLLRWLASRDFAPLAPRTFPVAAVALSSAAFGAVHGSWMLGAAAGVVFAAVHLHRGRLSDAVLAHALANAGVAAAVLLGGRWGLWA